MQHYTLDDIYHELYFGIWFLYASMAAFFIASLFLNNTYKKK